MSQEFENEQTNVLPEEGQSPGLGGISGIGMNGNTISGIGPKSRPRRELSIDNKEDIHKTNAYESKPSDSYEGNVLKRELNEIPEDNRTKFVNAELNPMMQSITQIAIARKYNGISSDEFQNQINERIAETYAMSNFYENMPKKAPGQPDEAYNAQIEGLKEKYKTSDEYKSQYEDLMTEFKQENSVTKGIATSFDAMSTESLKEFADTLKNKSDYIITSDGKIIESEGESENKNQNAEAQTGETKSFFQWCKEATSSFINDKIESFNNFMEKYKLDETKFGKTAQEMSKKFGNFFEKSMSSETSSANKSAETDTGYENV